MIPCFPANNSTDAHHCDIVSSCSSPSKQSSSHESKFSLSTSYRTTMDKERLCCYQHCSVIVCTVQYRHNIVYELPILVFYVRWRISPHNPHMNPRRYDATIRLDSLVSSSLALAGTRGVSYGQERGSSDRFGEDSSTWKFRKASVFLVTFLIRACQYWKDPFVF